MQSGKDWVRAWETKASLDRGLVDIGLRPRNGVSFCTLLGGALRPWAPQSSPSSWVSLPLWVPWLVVGLVYCVYLYARATWDRLRCLSRKPVRANMAVFDNTPCTTLNVKVTVGQIVTKQGWWPSKVLSLNTSPVRCYVGNSLCCRDLTPATLKTWKAATTAPHMIRVADRPKVATEKELRRRLDQSDCYPLLLTGNIQVAEYYEFEPQKCVLNSGIAATGVSLKQGCDCFPFGVENVWTFTDGEAVDLVMEVSFRRCRLDGAFILVLSTSPLWSKLPSEVKRMILSYAPIPGPPHTCSLHEKAWRRAPLWEDSASNTKFLQISAPSARFLLIDNTYPYCRR